MGLGEWLWGTPKSPVTKPEVKKKASVTMTASVDDVETHTSKQKFVLYGFLGFAALQWYDLLGAILGTFGKTLVVLIGSYIMVLCYPSSFGKYDMKCRMQIRSVLILKIGIFTALWCFPPWIVFLADNWRPFSWLPFPLLRTLFFLYIGWFLTFDRKAAKLGHRYMPSLRKRKFWKHIACYFPVQLTRTQELDPKKNYIFGYHPHGLISVGAITNFATFATSFDKLFPGIDLRVCTLALNFKIPLLREYFMGLGLTDASKESLMHNCSTEGRSCMIVIGGAAESLEAGIGENNLILKNRKGFVKMALKTGASLVPVYSFGENDLFEIVHMEGKYKIFQNWLQKKMGFAIPLFFGRALTGGVLHRLFGMNKGIFPLRTPIHSVVGSPIEIPQKFPNEEITDELIDKYHKLYIEELTKIHDEWTPLFLKEKAERLKELGETDNERNKIVEQTFVKLKNDTKEMELK